MDNLDIMADSDKEDDVEMNIAHRTRSQLRIENFVPNDNLDFPDVDMNLYQNPDSEGDPVYKKFLNQCYSEEPGTDNTNTDDNDPEYVYNDDIFSHGWRFDLDEISGFQRIASCPPEIAPIDNNQYDPVNISSLSAVPEFSVSLRPFRRKIDMFAEPEFARILNQQLRQHIQLLTQTFLLTKNTTNMRNEAEEAKSHLCSYMKIFNNKSKPSNLLPALNLVNNLPTPKDIKSSIRLSWRPLPVPGSVKTIIRENPDVFIYPSLLPQVAFSILPEKLMPKKRKINFTINEDKLLAYALKEFKDESSPYAFIASLLMTAKTKTQITNHIKNIKRSPGHENNPIKLYYANGELPEIDLDSDSHLEEIKIEDISLDEEDKHNSPVEDNQKLSEAVEESMELMEPIEPIESMEPIEENLQRDTNSAELQHFTPNSDFHQEHDDIMNMDLDDLMAASTTISKSSVSTGVNSNNSSENNKNIKNLKLKKSMLNLMSHNFLLSQDMGDLIIYEFLKAAQTKLSERNNLHLLQLLTDLMRRDSKKENDDQQTVVKIYGEISRFLEKIDAPSELLERVVLFLDLEQATKCGCTFSYLHWMRFFEFMQHVEMYHDGIEALEKKLVRLIDALQKDDPHKIKLAIGNLVTKHPFLKREFDSLSLDEKPHSSLFFCEEDFDDLTDPMSSMSKTGAGEVSDTTVYNFEHFISKLSEEELSYASQACPCKCHQKPTADGQPSQHCSRCNLKFMKGRMYLVNKIKPILAEWSYAESSRLESTPQKVLANGIAHNNAEWTFEEDREILEFCRSKAEQNEETISFDTSTFEELVKKRQQQQPHHQVAQNGGSKCKSAREIAERFNQLMEMYKDENLNTSGSQ